MSVVPLAQLISHNLTVEALSQNEYYIVNVTAMNIVGPSETFHTGFRVTINMSSENYIDTKDSFDMYIY